MQYADIATFLKCTKPCANLNSRLHSQLRRLMSRRISLMCCVTSATAV